MAERCCPPEPLSAPEHFTCSDGHKVSYYEYLPASAEPYSTHIVFLHGIQSHAGWYTGSCKELAAKGHHVLFLNRRGSGRDMVRRGDAPGWRRLVKDVQEFLLDQQQKHPGGRWILGGISWGGKVAAAVAARCPDLIEGLVLLCPGLVPIVSPPLSTRLSILFSSLFFPTQQYPIPLDDPALFTSSLSWQRFLDSDPDALKKASARFLVQSVRLDLWFRLNCRGWKVPTLLFLGLQEKIVNNKATRERIEDLAQGSIQVIEYPAAHHTLEFEGPEVPWVEDLDSWLGKIGHPGEMMPITPAG